MKQQLNIALGQASSRGLILLLPILGNFLFLASAKADLTSSLTIEVEGLKNKSGQICGTLFDQSKGFPSDSKKAWQSECIKITEMPQKLIFKDLKPGNYAVALIHDANGNGNLDTNSFGMPTEGFGFSQNPEVLTGPPKFNDSAVTVSKTNTDIKIKMKYFFGS
ncbi:DUF2141 domain-containing protein [Dolichospermum lemmermannii CS-548]|uniref:DUF2141 domain-containing protein n=1 Tax=Dolichospermum lemmermannii TaxID=54295 RepID=UPI00232FACD2|nr:DUF2141 domain-containing protein [Dolichospermum lemmermannii]MDB9435508.1 DUF2141 domain-containing protein [Dolichospermum lemmermannii CS-548]